MAVRSRLALIPALEAHRRELSSCQRCISMHKPVVAGPSVPSRILLVGQAPGDKEPVLGRPFAWTAGKTLFRWIESTVGWPEAETRRRIYFAAVCRCFPGKNPKGGDRVPNEEEIEACSHWLQREFEILRPTLVLAVGKLALAQFMPPTPLADMVGKIVPIRYKGHSSDLLPLPHPSGASTWHRTEPGKSLLQKALKLLAERPEICESSFIQSI